MLVVQCNCTGYRRFTGSINIACLYADTEVDFEGATNTYEFAGGSKFSTSQFLLNMQRIFFNKPAPELMEGMVSIPLGCFNNTNELAPRVEIGMRKS